MTGYDVGVGEGNGVGDGVGVKVGVGEGVGVGVGVLKSKTMGFPLTLSSGGLVSARKIVLLCLITKIITILSPISIPPNNHLKRFCVFMIGNYTPSIFFSKNSGEKGLL